MCRRRTETGGKCSGAVSGIEKGKWSKVDDSVFHSVISDTGARHRCYKSHDDYTTASGGPRARSQSGSLGVSGRHMATTAGCSCLSIRRDR